MSRTSETNTFQDLCSRRRHFQILENTGEHDHWPGPGRAHTLPQNRRNISRTGTHLHSHDKHILQECVYHLEMCSSPGYVLLILVLIVTGLWCADDGIDDSDDGVCSYDSDDYERTVMS